MKSFNREIHPHRRLNPLTQEWVLVSPQRTQRPWQGQSEKSELSARPTYDPECYLCAGNQRKNGIPNPLYQDVYVFTNDFSALTTDTPEGSALEHSLFQARAEKGLCRVICFSPRHDLTIAEFEVSSVEKVIRGWIQEYRTLGELEYVNHVQIFENKGAMMGCSNPHPHGQIWAQESIPNEPLKKINSQKKYYTEKNSLLLLDYCEEELRQETRIVFETNHFVLVIPYWAIWPFETMLIPKRARTNLTELSEDEIQDFALAYKKIAMLYDDLFQTSAPYSAGIHQAPTDGQAHPYYQMHMVFYPPLLRSATVKKFMVGYEMLGEPQRDLTPETCAEMLKKAYISRAQFQNK